MLVEIIFAGQYFVNNLSTQDEHQDIFNLFFSPSVSRVEKYVENAKKFVECRKIVYKIKTSKNI